MPDQEQIIPLTFPSNGINLIAEFELQLPDTTSVAVNVRGYEPSTQRQRGGSRPGLSKWINNFVNGTGPALIQDLDVLIRCDGKALLTSFGFDLNTPLVPDPNNPGFFVPAGGSGVQLNGNTGSTGPNLTGDGYVGSTSVSGSGPTFQAKLLPNMTPVVATSLSGTGSIKSGVGFIAVQIGTAFYFQPPTFTS